MLCSTINEADWGLFASKHIEAGAVIGLYKGADVRETEVSTIIEYVAMTEE